jgi:dipeptidase D
MDAKTGHIIHFFEQVSAIPRCSKKETLIAQWLQQWAASRQLTLRKDQVGNILIKVAPSLGFENAPVIVVQGHLDMVCEKSRQSDHDFAKDPIRLIYAGDWLRADATTLGADNGIAIAIGLALADDRSMAHPPLELLFTVDEETGLNGAKQLQPGFFEGKILLNLDVETEGVFTVGCAGGTDTHINCDLKVAELPDECELVELTVAGLRGGHSGMDIHRHRANANKILARALHRLKNAFGFSMVALDGGTAHNAIPRDAAAVLASKPDQFTPMQKMIAEFQRTVQSEYASAEEALALSLLRVNQVSLNQIGLTSAETDRVIHLLLALPHGVKEMSAAMDNLVETSSNLAKVAIKDRALHVVTSQRSSVMSRLAEITASIEATAALAGAATRAEDPYPAWQPNWDSPLLQRCKAVYRSLFNRDPLVQAIHAGLECGIIGSKAPGMDMISLGPTIENAHSPDERLNIPSIVRLWDFLAALLKSYGNQ